MDGGLVVLIVYLTGVLMLFAAAGFYRQYSGTDWEDMDGPLMLIWPITICGLTAVAIGLAAIRGGESLAAWAKARS